MRSTLNRRRTFPNRPRRFRAYDGGEILPVTFPTSVLATRVYIALGADLTASHLTWSWLDITDRCRHDLGITVTVGRRDERSQTTPARCQIKVDNNDSALTRRNPLSPYYGLLTPNTPIWIQLDPGSGFVDRFFGYVNEWPTTWADESGSDATVTIGCSGVMRRLAQDKALKSAMNRTMSGVGEGDFVPLAYWPMEDGSNSTQIASAVPGVSAASVSGTVNFASDSELLGSDPLLAVAATSAIAGTFPTYTNTNQWYLEVALKFPSAPSVPTDYLEVRTPGGHDAIWILHILPGSPDTVMFVGLNAAGAATGTGAAVTLDGSGPSNPSEAAFYGSWWHFTLFAYIEPLDGLVYGGMFLTDNGDWNAIAAGAGSTTVLGPAHSWLLHGRSTGVSAGHLALFVDPAFSTGAAVVNASAMDGHAGELAHERMRRLCREERVPFTTQALTSAAMGPQRSGTLLSQLRDCEATDQGFLYEHVYGLGFQALSERYNQPVTLELDFSQRHIAGVPQPADDDQRLLNRFTASRPNGSSATAEQTTGTMGTAASGIFESSGSANVETDSQLLHYAGWKVHLGTVDEDRWPQLGLRLHSTPELIPGWTSTPLGSRINVASPPSPMPSATIDAYLEGFTERWDQVSWTVGLNTSPASPYTVGVLDDTDMRLDSGSSTLASAVTAGASSMSVATTDSRDLWSTDSGDYPQDVTISGIHVTVTAVSGGSSPQTFTVTGATVLKDLGAGQEVHVRYPFVLAL